MGHEIGLQDGSAVPHGRCSLRRQRTISAEREHRECLPGQTAVVVTLRTLIGTTTADELTSTQMIIATMITRADSAIYPPSRLAPMLPTMTVTVTLTAKIVIASHSRVAPAQPTVFVLIRLRFERRDVVASAFAPRTAQRGLRNVSGPASTRSRPASAACLATTGVGSEFTTGLEVLTRPLFSKTSVGLSRVPTTFRVPTRSWTTRALMRPTS